ncbi:hypothetical protein [Vibrio breoganii]|uniref:hypothetical protein n=1 Tax=Vibrio breoganii TaxID=553239 RepID=UPI000C82864F|nr:hypothetical protein [Vibrio breoganii]PMK30627.1 hypothetical protein BCU03_09425 [Vibrio breoganii]
MNKSKSILANNVERRMADLKIRSNLQLSEMSGVSRAVITNIMLSPKKSIMVDSALLLAKCLQCRVEWMITGEGHINLDDAERNNRLHLGAPLFTINQISDSDPMDMIENTITDTDHVRFPCPTGNSPTKFAVRMENPIGRFKNTGVVIFDTAKSPVSGQMVIAKTSDLGSVEYMEYYAAHGRRFLRSLEEGIPEELKSLEMTEQMKIIATYECYVIF